jgi:hypothetical protein
MPFDNALRKDYGSFKHLMSYNAHRNTLMQMNVEMHSQELYTLGKDNMLKVWSLNAAKTKSLASRTP